MFVSALRMGRLFSKAYERLFSVTTNLNSIAQYGIYIDSMKSDLEAWRVSIPDEFRPGSPTIGTRMSEGCLRLHFSYYNLAIALARAALYVSRKAAKSEADDVKVRAAENDLMESARAVARLTICIDIRPYTPLW